MWLLNPSLNDRELRDSQALIERIGWMESFVPQTIVFFAANSWLLVGIG
jgi:hypothetical protein